jgi:hypothetical protein
MYPIKLLSNNTLVFVCALLVHLFFYQASNAQTSAGQTYEGYLVNPADGAKYPIWMEVQANGATLSGSYFYKRVGTAIPLEGTSAGNSRIIKEKDGKGKVTGTFSFSMESLPVRGQWKDAAGKKSLHIELYPVDPSYRAMAVIPKHERLLMADGSSFMDAIKESSSEDVTLGNGKLLKPTFTFARRGFATYTVVWEMMGAYPTTNTDRYVFDIKSSRIINVYEEFDLSKREQFKQLLVSKVAAQLEDHWKTLDTEGKQVLRDAYATDPYPGFEFGANNMPNYNKSAQNIEVLLANAYLTDDGVVFSTTRFYDFPHAIQVYDAFVEVVIPYGECAKYLSPGSELLRLSDI